jgi:outer membrane lipoprotein-sorting protein
MLDSTFFLKKAILKDRSGKSLRFTISGVDTSATLIRTMFDFNPPANAQLIKNPLEVK